MDKKIFLILIIFTTLIANTIQSTDQSVLKRSCTLNAECSPPYITCQEKECKHKSLFPMETKEIFGTVIFVLLAMLSAAAGIGGGALMVPILLMMFDFDTKQSVALANGIIFFSGAVKFFVGIRRTHPKIPHRTLINYNVVLIFISSVLLGAFIGSIVSPSIPEFLQLIGLVIVVVLAMLKSFKKSVSLYKKENIAMSKVNVQKPKVQQTETEMSIPEEGKIAQEKRKDTEGDQTAREPINKKKEFVPEKKELTAQQKKTQQEIRKIEGSNFNPKKFGIVLGVLICSLIIIFLRGGKGLESIVGIHRC